MTINYADGTVVEMLLLSQTEECIRAVVPGDADTRTFNCVNGVWISEGGEPVAIEFQWQRNEKVRPVGELDCVCSKDLASRLISLLLNGEGRKSADSTEFLLHEPPVECAAAAYATIH